MAEVESARANPTLAGGEPASGANPPLTKSDGTEREDTDGSSDRDNVQRMQLEMLKRENAELGSKLETLTQQLRVRCDFADTNHIFESSFAQSDTLDRELCAVPAAKKQKKVPRTKEVLLVFEGDLQTCCRKTISAKLLHLKRLLHRRLEARLSPTPESLHSLMHVLLAARRIAPPSPQERLRVQASVPLSDEARETLRREILSVVSFTLGAKLPEEAVTFIELCPEAEEYQRSLCPQVASRPACVQVVITAFNHGTHAELRIQDSVLTEVCESESSGGSVSWARFMGKYVNVGFVNKDMMRLGQDDRTVVCSSASNTRCGSISLYFPTHLESFFTDRALRDTLQPGALLHSLLAEHIDAIHFEEWRAGSILVPARMAEWIAADLWTMLRSNSTWLTLLQQGLHVMTGVRIDSWSCWVTPHAERRAHASRHVLPASAPLHRAVQEGDGGDGEGAGELRQHGDTWAGIGGAADEGSVGEVKEETMELYFHQERQQELLRRQMVGLESIVHCNDLVSHVEAHVARLHSQAQELCGRVDWRREQSEHKYGGSAEGEGSVGGEEDQQSLGLDKVCSQLQRLSSECEMSIDAAMDAIQAVSEVFGDEAVIHSQLTRVLRARTAKQQVRRLTDQATSALQQRRCDRCACSGRGMSAEGGREVIGALLMVGESVSGGRAAAADGGAGAGSGEAQAAFNVKEGLGKGMNKVGVGVGVGGRGGGGGGGVAMVKELEDGLQAHREQQEKLVCLWLQQHEVMRSELQRLLSMANTEGSTELLGLVALQTRFQEYIAFLEEHEAVEDTMLFPMAAASMQQALHELRALFPQSAQDLDQILDPERHKSVDAVNAGVGRLLQQLLQQLHERNQLVQHLHHRQIALNEMSLSSQEMRRVVDALERLNDYMVGHIRYEEEVTMPWLRQASGASAGVRRPPIAV